MGGRQGTIPPRINMHTFELSSHYVLEFNILAAAIVWRNDFRVYWIIVPERIELSV